MRNHRIVALFVVLLMSACWFAFAEEGDQPKAAGEKIAPADLLMLYSPYLISVKDGEDKGQEEEPNQPNMRMQMQREGWRMGVLISDNIAMYPFAVRSRMMMKFRIAQGGEVDKAMTLAPASGNKIAAEELGMKVDLSVAFAKVELPEDAGAVKLDMTKSTMAKTGDVVYVIGRRGDDWNFAPFFLPAIVNGELIDGNMHYFSLNLTQQQLGEEANGALVVREDGEVLGIISTVAKKQYSVVIVPLSNFKAAIDNAINAPETLDSYDKLPDFSRNPGGANPGGANPGGRNPGGRNPGGQGNGNDGNPPRQ